MRWLLILLIPGLLQGLETVNWVVNGHRPLATVADKLEKTYNVRITYEDAPYVYEKDLVDQAIPEYQMRGIHSYVVRQAQVEASYAIDNGQLEHLPTVLQRILDDYTLKGNPGVFSWMQLGDVFHVVPVQVKDRHGVFRNVKSILDTPVRFPFKRRRFGETLDEIFDQIHNQTGRKVRTGSGIGPNLAIQFCVGVEANNESARDVLMRTFDQTARKYSWRLFYQPDWDYVLNVHTVGEVAPIMMRGPDPCHP